MLSPVLRVLVQDRTDPDGRVLPGRFLRERQTVVDTVHEVFEHKVGVTPSEVSPPRLLRVFDEPDRDDRTWAISVTYSVSMPEAALAGAKGDLVAVTRDGALTDGGPMLWDHDEIVRAAVLKLRERYEFRQRYNDTPPDPNGFLPHSFTLHQLRKVHEAVIGEELHKDDFARRMKPQLKPVIRGGQVVRSEATRGRPRRCIDKSSTALTTLLYVARTRSGRVPYICRTLESWPPRPGAGKRAWTRRRTHSRLRLPSACT